MNIIFAGTPGFSSVSLRALVEAGYKIPLVITQPDRRAGRGMLMMPSEVKKTAISLGINTYQPISLKSPDVFERIHRENADVMIVVAFGQIVPKSILSVFPLGCINVHASLLPRWRGAAPIQRAIMAGDSETGVCIMQMEAGLDTRHDLHRALHERQSRPYGGLSVDILHLYVTYRSDTTTLFYDVS